MQLSFLFVLFWSWRWMAAMSDGAFATYEWGAPYYGDMSFPRSPEDIGCIRVGHRARAKQTLRVYS